VEKPSDKNLPTTSSKPARAFRGVVEGAVTGKVEEYSFASFRVRH
jgi:hypothetical protein